MRRCDDSGNRGQRDAVIGGTAKDFIGKNDIQMEDIDSGERISIINAGNYAKTIERNRL